MRLRRVAIEGFRSVRDPLELAIDPKVTVILGANDHGKSNILSALLMLDHQRAFAPDDLNWDRQDEGAELPRIEAEFELSPAQQGWLAKQDTAGAEGQLPAAPAKTTEGSTGAQPPDVDPSATPGSEGAGSPEPSATRTKRPPRTLTVIRRPAGLKVRSSLALTEETEEAIIGGLIPSFELFSPVVAPPDSATAANIADEAHEFLRGIFALAGLAPPWDAIFPQNQATARRLSRASDLLNEVLRSNWSQGSELKFLLRHDSSSAAIELLIEDPAVADRYVHVSQRSAGFTNFFALRTILHARAQTSGTNSHIWLFDEPGLNLHPAGQYDLIQAVEAVSQTSQIVYSTHSLFLINKNFPTRHRLIKKSERGTTADSKPYVGRWQPALEAMGLSLPGTMFFASHVLLTEGDSAPILLLAGLRKLLANGHFDFDLNAFSALATNNGQNANALIRILAESRPKPTLAMLVDGDQGGRDRLRNLGRLLENHQIQQKMLARSTSLEDYLPNPDLYVRSAARYAAAVAAMDAADALKLEGEMLEAFLREWPKTDKVAGLAEWTRHELQSRANLASKPSKVGIGREYALALADEGVKLTDARRFRELAHWIREALQLPSTAASGDTIVGAFESADS